MLSLLPVTPAAAQVRKDKKKGVVVRVKPSRTVTRKNKETAAYRGNQNTLSRSNQNAGRRENISSKSLETANFRGNIPTKGKPGRERRANAYSRRGIPSAGRVSQNRINQRYRDLRSKDRRVSGYRGNIRTNARSNQSAGLLVNKGGGNYESSNYRGNISVRGQQRRSKKIAANNRRMAAYRGNIRTNARSNQSAGLLVNKGGGDLETANYRGNISRRSVRSRERTIKKNNKKMAAYRGDIRISKRPKGAYPGSTYRGGRVANSYTKKEKYRQRMLKRLNKNKKLQRPNYQRKSDEKPSYDSRESEIWNKPGRPGSFPKK